MDYLPAITTAATAHGLDPRLVQAVCTHESSLNPWAWKPEPAYRYLWNVKAKAPFRPLSPDEVRSKLAPADFPYLAGSREQEWWAQQCSWGLMQLMGALARELGFTGSYLPAIADPATCLDLGCTHLARLLQRAQGDRSLALAMWNGGSKPNAQAQAYSVAVIAIYNTL